jgi:eukaryotic-like serine/threonine-protein kinase
MLDKLKGIFGSKQSSGPPAPPKPVKMKRVNIDRRFNVIALTGQGSMSRVQKATDNETGRTVCLKVQHLAKHAAANARSAADLRPPEGEIASKVIHHHVVRTYEYGLTHKGEHFIVMEFVEGVSLAFVREAKSANLAQKLELLAQAAEGLAAVHAAGFIHHDVGPKNFLVNRDNQVKLIDFGLAVPNTAAFRRPGNRTGTILYMAPELVRRESIDEKIDIFSFGAVAFEFITNRLPYDANPTNSIRLNLDALDPAQVDPTLPEPVCEILRKLTARKKDDRWPKMATLPEALRQIRVDAKRR